MVCRRKFEALCSVLIVTRCLGAPHKWQKLSISSTSEAEVPTSSGTGVPTLHPEYLRILGSPRGKNSNVFSASSEGRFRSKHRRLPSVDPSEVHRNFVPPPESEPSPRSPPKSREPSESESTSKSTDDDGLTTAPSSASTTESAASVEGSSRPSLAAVPVNSELESKLSNIGSTMPPPSSATASAETKSSLSTSEGTASDAVGTNSRAPRTSSSAAVVAAAAVDTAPVSSNSHVASLDSPAASSDLPVACSDSPRNKHVASSHPASHATAGSVTSSERSPAAATAAVGGMAAPPRKSRKPEAPFRSLATHVAHKKAASAGAHDTQPVSPVSSACTEQSVPAKNERVGDKPTSVRDESAGVISASAPEEHVSEASPDSAQSLDVAESSAPLATAATNANDGVATSAEQEEKRANVATSQDLRVRIVSFNMHGQTDKVGDFRRMLRGEHIICLQEVDDIEGTTAQYIEDYPFVYSSTNSTSFTNAWTLVQKIWRFRRTSIMVLSKFPLEHCADTIVQTDPGGDNWQRNAQHVVVRLPASASHLVEEASTHGQDAGGGAADETPLAISVSSTEAEDGSSCLHLFHYHNTYNWHKESSASESAGVEKFLMWVKNRLSPFEDDTSSIQYVLAGDFNLVCRPGKQGGKMGAVPMMLGALRHLSEQSIHVSNNWVDYVCSPLPMVSNGVYRTRQCGVSDHDAAWAEFSTHT